MTKLLYVKLRATPLIDVPGTTTPSFYTLSQTKEQPSLLRIGVEQVLSMIGSMRPCSADTVQQVESDPPDRTPKRLG